MADKFTNLRQLLAGTEDLPEVSQTPGGPGGLFDPAGSYVPAYEQFLKNAREAAISGLSEPVKSPTHPLLKDYPHLKDIEGMAPTLRREEQIDRLDPRRDAPHKRYMDRQRLNKAVAEAYVRDMHPEMLQNIKSDEGLEDNLAEKLRYQRQIMKELTGRNDVNMGITNDPRTFGFYRPEANAILLNDPTDFATGIHESLHKHYQKDYPVEQGVPEDLLPDVLTSGDLTRTMQEINRAFSKKGHIPYQLKAARDIASDEYRGSAAYNPAKATQGESAFMYDQIRHLLKNQK